MRRSFLTRAYNTISRKCVMSKKISYNNTMSMIMMNECTSFDNQRNFSSNSGGGSDKNDDDDDDVDLLGTLREFESEKLSSQIDKIKSSLNNSSDNSVSTSDNDDDATKIESEYEDMLDELIFETGDIADKTKPTDEFLRKINPVLFYKRKVNQMWGRNECYFCETDHVSDLHYTNIPLLSFFVSEGGNILPRRVSHCCAKHQRKLARTIKHSRHLGLFPFRGNMSGRFPLDNEGGNDDTSKNDAAASS